MRRDARGLAELMLGLGDVREGGCRHPDGQPVGALCPETYLWLTSDGRRSGDRYVAWLADTMGAVIY